MKERYWETTHDGMDARTPDGPILNITINFRNPADIGFDKEKLKTFKGTIVCAGNEFAPVIMVHFVRPIEGGSELRTRFWTGWGVRDGKPFKCCLTAPRFPPRAPKNS
jgi:hypothetical protein